MRFGLVRQFAGAAQPRPGAPAPAPGRPPLLALDGGGRGGADLSAARPRLPALPRLPAPPHPQERATDLSLGPDLVKRGVVSAAGLMEAMVEASRRRVPLPRMLRSLGLADDRALAVALAARIGGAPLGPDDLRADPRLIAELGVARCVRTGCLPLRRAGAVTLVATTDPEQLDRHRAGIEAALGPVVAAVVAEGDLLAALERAQARPLRRAAQTSVETAESCRNWDGARAAGWGLALAAALALALLLAPVALFLTLLGLLLGVLVLSTGLRLAAAVAALGLIRTAAPDGSAGPAPRPAPPPDAPPPDAPPVDALPVISVMVPLFREPEIAPRLIARLGALDYPRDRLDVLLVVEADDHITRDALARTRLPGWLRVIPVPEAPLRTKPRALNYALNYARGTLIGVYDAEDAPDRDQLRRVAAAFARGGPKLACVQGLLDYYNSNSNWMARCFTIEYAAWFRLVLTGFARLGLVVPLGGTTLFFRRDILERLGGWDAHNVTEDADLGVRLARRGYRTDLVQTVTQEEANCRILPWIKQRSRWLKGYAMTYAVHMRSPRRLWRDLGAWRFFGVQMLFLGTLIQFLLAPVFWSLWLLMIGLDLPLARAIPAGTGTAVLAILLGCEAVNIGINLAALGDRRHRPLRPWVFTLGAYFPLATLAAYKAIWEMLVRPFYWDKTTHGVDDAGHRTPVALG